MHYHIRCDQQYWLGMGVFQVIDLIISCPITYREGGMFCSFVHHVTHVNSIEANANFYHIRPHDGTRKLYLRSHQHTRKEKLLLFLLYFICNA